MSEMLVLVDEHDAPLGEMEKLEAHQKGILHRACSVFVFNSKGEMMLQQRAAGKYHSALLWTNTCCTHPRPGEAPIDTAHRRLREEMGFDCPMESIGAMTYRTEFPNGLIEHEYDHLFLGKYDGEPKLNPEEAASWKWIAPETLAQELKAHPEQYTYWLNVAFDRVMAAVR
jgi:isopentenyl-diphosphate delta-isomerase